MPAFYFVHYLTSLYATPSLTCTHALVRCANAVRSFPPTCCSFCPLYILPTLFFIYQFTSINSTYLPSLAASLLPWFSLLYLSAFYGFYYLPCRALYYSIILRTLLRAWLVSALLPLPSAGYRLYSLLPGCAATRALSHTDGDRFTALTSTAYFTYHHLPLTRALLVVAQRVPPRITRLLNARFLRPCRAGSYFCVLPPFLRTRGARSAACRAYLSPRMLRHATLAA